MSTIPNTKNKCQKSHGNDKTWTQLHETYSLILCAEEIIWMGTRDMTNKTQPTDQTVINAYLYYSSLLKTDYDFTCNLCGYFPL